MNSEVALLSGNEEAKRSQNGLIIFLRVAEKGKVKTRLADSIGETEALQIYQKLVKMTLAQARQTPSTIYLYFYPVIDESFDHDSKEFILRKQHGEDLGQKMKHALDEVLVYHRKAVIIGTDCPYLTTELITKAFEALDDHDVVIGPASDGGYYLLGLKKNRSELFSGIVWSTRMVLPLTMEKINHLQWSSAFLPTLSDIDYEEDWLKYLKTSQL